MTDLVVDANVVVKWLVDEDQVEDAARVLRSDSDLHAPRFLAAEVADVLWQKASRGEVTPEAAGTLADSLDGMPLIWADDEAFLSDAVRLAIEIGHPAYDCIYLALARRLGAPLVTADMRFVNRVAPTMYANTMIRLSDYRGE
ncbi:MAG: type II toxin-antitoxin system VapC family toxin [Chloroflexi bacterium]|nr:type II toxin-antitoxin system VapC family toxin [Chloroflexota bacterium]